MSDMFVDKLPPWLTRVRWDVFEQWGQSVALWADPDAPGRGAELEACLQLLLAFLLSLLLWMVAEQLWRWCNRRASGKLMGVGEAYELVLLDGPARVAELRDWYVTALGYDECAAAAAQPQAAAAGGAPATPPAGKRKGARKAAPDGGGRGTGAVMVRSGAHAVLLQDAGALLRDAPALAAELAPARLPLRARYQFVADIASARDCLSPERRQPKAEHRPTGGSIRPARIVVDQHRSAAGVWELWYVDPVGCLAAYAQEP